MSEEIEDYEELMKSLSDDIENSFENDYFRDPENCFSLETISAKLDSKYGGKLPRNIVRDALEIAGFSPKEIGNKYYYSLRLRK